MDDEGMAIPLHGVIEVNMNHGQPDSASSRRPMTSQSLCHIGIIKCYFHSFQLSEFAPQKGKGTNGIC
jgi:hypothetical protein